MGSYINGIYFQWLLKSSDYYNYCQHSQLLSAALS